MASRYFNQFISTLCFEPVFIDGSFQVGFNGAVVPNSFVGAGISASSTVTVQNLGTGVYRLQLADPYYRLRAAQFTFIPGPSSAAVSDGSGNIVIGAPYQILGGTSGAPGTSGGINNLPSTATNWYTLGLYPGLNPAVGMLFVATSAASNTPGSSTVSVGQGLMQAVGVTGIDAIEVLPDMNLTLAPTSASSGVQGALVHFQVLRSTSASNVMTRYNPSSATIRYKLYLGNSSRLSYNESTTAN